MDWSQILVIILASFLAMFLLLAIVLVVLLIVITRRIKKVASSAELTVSALGIAVSGLSRASLPLSIAQMIFKQVMKSRSKKRK